MCEKSGGRLGVEVEAAEVLAALSHHHTNISGKKRREGFPMEESERFNPRFKNTNESSTNLHDRFGVLKNNHTNTISSMAIQPERAEQEFHRMRYKVRGSGSCIKSRDHLTEAEREERRIRRILANRESARQTIRRRQAIYEQLVKNAAVLDMENKNLKTEKEQALAKYSSLKSMNERLKDSLEAAKAELIKEQCGDPELSTIEPSTSSTAPTLLCHQPPTVPFFWPPYFHPSDAFPLQSSQVVPSLVSHVDPEQGIHESNGKGAQVYVLPFPWLFPLQMQYIAQNYQPSIQCTQPGDSQNEVCMNLLSSACTSSQAEGHIENYHVNLLPAREDDGFGVAPNVKGKQTAETVPFNATSYPTGASASSWPSHTPQQPQEEDMAEMEAVSPSTWSLATKSDAPILCPSKKSAGAAAAAEARRRRKELTKLKSLYYRNNRMR